MLNYCNPTFVGLCSGRLLTFVYIFEGDLAKFFCIGLDRWASECAVKVGVTFELACVAHELYIDRRRNRISTAIRYFVRQFNFIVAAFKGIGFGELYTVLFSIEN